jgi:glycosyltransferase involved in cell wall biosynthesis
MLAHFCGTTVSQLGFLKGFEKLAERWEISVVAQRFAIEAHDLSGRFPKLRITEEPDGYHAAMIHMNQLCFSGILCDLHRHGFATACNMLDTIMWDMILGAPEHVGRIWDLDASYLDAIFYNSGFSRDQFNRRFPVAGNILEVITFHSFKVEENTTAEYRGAAVGDYVLVFGNSYDHKDVLPTVQRLRSHFPPQPIIALGPECVNVENVTFLSSGTLPDEKVEELVASAKVVLFPSWNEGFGLPVVKALAYGRPVVVRELPLWEEIASQCRLPGVLMSFCDEETLCAVVSAALSGHSERVIEQGGAVLEEPLDWTACAERILDGFEQYLESADSTAWLQREKVVRVLDQKDGGGSP